MTWLRDWLTSLPDAELRRSRFVRKSFDTGDTGEPCSDYDPEFSANPSGPGFHPTDHAQGRGASRFNPYRKLNNGEVT